MRSLIEQEYGYQPNDINSDMFLSEIPLNLLKENIKAQFDDPLEFRKKDHLTTFLNMYHFSKEHADAYEDEDIDKFIELREDFYGFMLNIFREYLNIGFVNFDDMGEDEQDNLIHYIYRFFLMNIKRNFVHFIINYIDDNKELLIQNFGKKKDVTSLSFTKEVTDPADIVILSNMYDIIRMILDPDEIDIDSFLNACDDDMSLERRVVQAAYDSDKITGNFIPKYINMIDGDFESEIETKIRNKILKKYKKK